MKYFFKNQSILTIIFVFIFLFIWQLTGFYRLVPTSVLPMPSDIVESIWLNFDQLIVHSSYTILESILGFLIAIFMAIMIGLGLFYNQFLLRIFYPLLATAHIIPIIAIAPLLLIWFGFGLLPKILVVVIYSFFPITASLLDGLSETPKSFIEYGKSLGLSRFQILTQIRFKSALPQLFSGLKIASLYAVSGAVVGEFVGAYKGLGIYLLTSLQSRAVALVFAICLFIILWTLLMNFLVRTIENMILSWKKYETANE